MSVVRVRRKGEKVVQGCDVYIGRKMTMGGWDLPQSDWANPFTVKECGSREEAVERYEAWLWEKRPDLLERLGELKGKTLEVDNDLGAPLKPVTAMCLRDWQPMSVTRN